MRRIFLIIDGYNLMHAAGFARRSYAPGVLERCRNRFLKQLQAMLTNEASGSCTVVFDAFNAPDESCRQVRAGTILVEFADPGQDADSQIEQLLRSHSAPRQVLIVSSDHRLQTAARRRRAKCVDSEVFWYHLTKDDHPSPAADQADPSGLPSTHCSDQLIEELKLDGITEQMVSPAVENYEQEFLNVDVEQIAREVKREKRRSQ